MRHSPAAMIPPHNSLVKYDNPILVSTTGKKGKKGAKEAATAEGKQPSQTRDILNSILPPRCAQWTLWPPRPAHGALHGVTLPPVPGGTR